MSVLGDAIRKARADLNIYPLHGLAAEADQLEEERDEEAASADRWAVLARKNGERADRLQAERDDAWRTILKLRELADLYDDSGLLEGPAADIRVALDGES